MTDRFAYELRFERALDALGPQLAMEQLTKLEIITLGSIVKYYGYEIIEALELATEAEQTRKERDELAKTVVASSGLTSWGKQEKYMIEYAETTLKRIIENGNA